ncbi:Uncharacterized protein APZ42_010491, partial [Daphnia magna]
RAQLQWEDLWHAEDRDGARERRRVVKLTHSPLASKREERCNPRHNELHICSEAAYEAQRA